MAQFDVLRRFKVSGLGVAAAALAVISALAAFVAPLLDDMGQRRVMINEQMAPMAKRTQTLLAETAQAQAKGNAAAPNADTDAPARHAFVLSRGASALPLGALSLRLTRTDSNRKLYDVVVLMNGRSYSHRSIKASQPLWIAVDHGKRSMEMVADNVGQNSISGYWLEMNAKSRWRHR